ncbi:MAG: alkaline phosphatase family protein, partial [Polyangiaceae bacterium]
ESWEYVDHLRRVDAALAGLSDWLEKTRGPVRFLVTADHGITPNPLRNPAGGDRLYPDEVTALAKEAAAEAAGDADLVDRYVRPFVYFAPGLSGDRRAEVVAAVESRLSAHAGIRLAVDVRTAASWRGDPDRVRRAVALSIAPGGPGDVYVVPEEHWVVDEGRPEGAGTTHGTPWRGDREVPVVIFGAGIGRGVHEEELSLLRVAPTISRLLEAAPPSGVTEAPLPGLEPP